MAGILDLLSQTWPARMAQGLISLPERVTKASGILQRQGDVYDPGPALEAAMLPMGGTFAVARGAGTLGAGPIRAYHGSPHDFERFDLSKVGTGEGGQAYGHGLYFAENPKVAQTYKDLPKSEGAGKMYEVGINSDPEKFLDWHKVLSKEHQQIFDNLMPARAGRFGGATGQSAYDDLMYSFKDLPNMPARQARATEALKEAGIPGIRYLDQGSRSAGEGTHNYVVFDDKLIGGLKKTSGILGE